MHVKHALYRGGMSIFDAFSCTLTEKNPHGNGLPERLFAGADGYASSSSFAIGQVKSGSSGYRQQTESEPGAMPWLFPS